MFGDEWSGHEVRTGEPWNDLRPVEKRKTEIEAFLVKLDDRLRELDSENTADLTLAERDRRGEEYGALKSKQRKLRKEYHDLPDLTNCTHELPERFDRRCAVESELKNAFKEGDLQLMLGDGVPIEWDRWAAEAQFHVDFYLSTVRAPEQFGAMGIGPALVPMQSFDGWITRFGPGALKSGEMTITAQLERYLREQFEKDPHEEISKSEFKLRAAAEFSEHNNYSGEEFDRVWRIVASPSRKTPGRKRKKSRIN
ncbi:hypothetical protein [Aliiroseovarius subalbicans]|uniref:hypothetical protein n=1 Tax=Aliiroseovarius subalbicans TaxID=2925840 RepID=UPI001F55F2C5|nr:hypothetical protein [Aliiroseovarius subalbicans]MCI2400410.1 hypothetical protein [Aliiroseovarius subalbicans]